MRSIKLEGEATYICIAVQVISYSNTLCHRGTGTLPGERLGGASVRNLLYRSVSHEHVLRNHKFISANGETNGWKGSRTSNFIIMKWRRREIRFLSRTSSDLSLFKNPTMFYTGRKRKRVDCCPHWTDTDLNCWRFLEHSVWRTGGNTSSPYRRLRIKKRWSLILRYLYRWFKIFVSSFCTLVEKKVQVVAPLPSLVHLRRYDLCEQIATTPLGKQSVRLFIFCDCMLRRAENIPHNKADTDMLLGAC